jgi:hypothetical protein
VLIALADSLCSAVLAARPAAAVTRPPDAVFKRLWRIVTHVSGECKRVLGEYRIIFSGISRYTGWRGSCTLA